MARAHRDLVAKAIAEFTHERLLAPTRPATGWRLDSALRRTTSRLAARPRALGRRRGLDRRGPSHGEPAPLDAQDFIVECNDVLGIPDHLLPIYLEEIASTLASAAWKLTHHQLVLGRPRPRRLPGDRGRDDRGPPRLRRQQRPDRLRRRRLRRLRAGDRCRTSACSGSPYAASEAHALAGARAGPRSEHYRAELGEDVARRLRGAAARPRAGPGRLPLPARPPVAVDATGWRSRSRPTSPGRRWCCSARGRARTARSSRSAPSSRSTTPTRSYVKVALAIQNMGFLRGLSPAYMAATPAINDWVADRGR